jgi:uncharacterized heparinase superfamily protein
VTSPLTYWRTIRHLRQEQILGRLRRTIWSPPLRSAPAPGLRPASNAFGAPIPRAGPIRRDHAFRFLASDGTVAAAPDWNDRKRARLWLFHLHYFDWLREDAAPRRVADDAAWIDRWIVDNPVGHGVGWEPYPLSLRIVNWIIWLRTIGTSDEVKVDSLATQARQLARSVEYHLLGNHLIANAKALVFAGAFFAGAEADHWRSQGLALLGRELPEQILADGAHFELSPMYHALILEDVLDLIGLAAVYPDVLAEPAASLRLAETAARMSRWLRQMLHPDGDIPFFNDATFGAAATPAQLFAYAAARGISEASPVGDRVFPKQEGVACTVLEPSGYAVLAAPPLHLIFDCGRIGPDYLPGHAHADTLAFEVSLGRERLISNSGTSTYEVGAERDWERSTAAHATVAIDGASSAETWASFRVGRRPNVGPIAHGSDGAGAFVECRHDGHSHLAGAPVHRRRVAATAGQAEITDWIDGDGRHEVAGVLPLHPGTGVETLGDRRYRLATPSDLRIALDIDGPVRSDVRPGRFAPAFGRTVERPVITWRWDGDLPLTVATRLRVVGG